MKVLKEKAALFLAVLIREPWVYFEKELALIKDESMVKLVKDLMIDAHRADKRNFVGPASSSGKYHPPFDNGYGGTARHTKAVVRALTTFQEAYPDKDWDCIYAAALLHDLAKYKRSEEHSDKDHAIAMMNIVHMKVKGDPQSPIPFHGFPDERGEQVARLIGSHMGRWEKKAHLLPKGFFETDEAKFLHLADMIVSRKWYGEEVVL